jgi:hypothetical protein
MTWTTKTNIKTLLGIADTSLDNVIDLLIPQAEELVKGYLQREIEETTYTEYYSGTGNQILILNQSPVQSVTSVYENPGGFYGDGLNAFPASSELVQGTNFVLRKDHATTTEASSSGILYRLRTVWPRPSRTQRDQLASAPGTGKGNIKVIYTAGWETVPADIQFATNRLVTSMLESRSRSGRIQSESIEDYSYSLAGTGEENRMLDSVKGSLARYRKVVI